jgi:uncharacterized protein with GYD domain
MYGDASGGGLMARYVTFFSYTGEAAARMVERPADREAAARAVIHAAGGRLEAFYWMFGAHDGLAIYEVPDAVTAAATSLAVAGTGLMRSIETHQLLDAQEALLALEQAARLAPAYRPPGTDWREDYDALG